MQEFWLEVTRNYVMSNRLTELEQHIMTSVDKLSDNVESLNKLIIEEMRNK